MNKTKIEWCDCTWNPVTGCLHGCPYCYAQRIARRFSGYWNEEQLRHFGANGEMHDLEKPMYRHTTGKNRSAPVHDVQAPYPFGFDPTLHRYRLNEPEQEKKPKTIFVVSMGDLFGDWIPEDWIREVFAACERASQHRYLFLTKNPKRYQKFFDHEGDPERRNFWLGTSVTDNCGFELHGPAHQLYEGTGLMGKHHANRFLSIEPLLGPINETALGNIKFFQWAIVGAETGSRKEKVVPQREWIEAIVKACDAVGVPVFMKNSLAKVWGTPLIQEFPW